MLAVPFHLRYKLTRRQRLTPHLRIWGRAWTAFVVPLFLFFSTNAIIAVGSFSLLGFAFLALMVFVLNAGLIDVLFIPVREMDVIVDDTAAHVLIGGERWCLFLDGITHLERFCDYTWTVRHFNGTALHISADAVTDEQIAHLRDAMARGGTPEGIAAVIERWRRMQG